MHNFAPSFCCFRVKNTLHRSNGATLSRGVSPARDETRDRCAGQGRESTGDFPLQVAQEILRGVVFGDIELIFGERLFLVADPCALPETQRLTSSRESLDSRPDGRALRVHLVRYSRAVPLAGGIASRNPRSSPPAQYSAP